MLDGPVRPAIVGGQGDGLGLAVLVQVAGRDPVGGRGKCRSLMTSDDLSLS